MSDVLLLFEHPSLNGGERSLLVLLDPLQRAGMRFRAVVRPHGPLAMALAAAGVETVPWPQAEPGRGRGGGGQRRADLAHILQKNKPDLLHANSLATSRLAGPVAAELGIPSVGHLRDMMKLSQAAIADLNCHNRLLAVSQATRDYHLSQGVEASRTFVAYNGVDLRRFCPRRPSGWLHKLLRLPPDRCLVGGVGQIILRKGWDVWLQAAKEVVRQNCHAHFVLVGQRHADKRETCQLEQRLWSASRQGTLRGRLHLLGTREDMHLLLPELAVLAHAARQEPLGRVLLEAAACGVPVVATDIGGTREIFADRSAVADLVPVDDAARLAAAILKVLERPAAAGRQADPGSQWVGQRFDYRQAGRTLCSHYQAVLCPQERGQGPSGGGRDA